MLSFSLEDVFADSGTCIHKKKGLNEASSEIGLGDPGGASWARMMTPETSSQEKKDWRQRVKTVAGAFGSSEPTV